LDEDINATHPLYLKGNPKGKKEIILFQGESKNFEFANMDVNYSGGLTLNNGYNRSVTLLGKKGHEGVRKRAEESNRKIRNGNKMQSGKNVEDSIHIP